LRKERHFRCETVEKVLRKMLGDSSVTAVDVFKVDCSICGSRHFLSRMWYKGSGCIKFIAKHSVIAMYI